jgi:filamentous hemagglutinin
LPVGTTAGGTPGRDTNNETTISTQGGALIGKTSIDCVAGVYVSNPGSTLFASAGRDVNLSGGLIADQGAGSHTSIKAKNGIDASSSTFLEGLAYGRGSLPVAFGLKVCSHEDDCLSKMVMKK